MKALVAGVVAGAAAVGVAWWLVAAGSGGAGGDAPASASKAPPPSRRAEPRPALPAVAPRVRAAESAPDAASAPVDDAPFAPGAADLRVGDGYVFGERAPRRGQDAEGADILCVDITAASVALRTAHGGRLADVPLGVLGMPQDVEGVAALVTDAPERLDGDVVVLGTRASAKSPGVGLVRSASGATYKVYVTTIVRDVDVRLRVACLEVAMVPTRANGGVVALPVPSSAAGAPTLDDLTKIVAAGAALPGDSFAHFLDGEYERLSTTPRDITVDGRHLLVDDAIRANVTLGGNGSLVAARGIVETGRVQIGGYAGVAVRGDMAGEINVGNYAYVHISGNLTGTLSIDSYATVVIDGDLRGEAVLASATTLLLRGRVLGKLTIRDSSSKIWIQGYLGGALVEQLSGGGSELHLQKSDLAAGTHTDIPGWSKVVVGEDAWSVIAR